ncbi:MAG: DUF4332 domain-containing protein [Hyphomicrobiaceae bacterium]|nr:DUF4332 domain-containing protein [Hyphomicrobiaceae bacterium]
MSLATRLIRAAYATGTHHKLALDALDHLAASDAEAWRRLFYSEVSLYLDGAKAPDTEFKDFKNHVLHPGDGYWGGAPDKARNWYTHLCTALTEKKWGEAAWCAGVLSHYVTDPAMPFHTAQSEAENAIHRAAEWSASRIYAAALREAGAGISVPAPPRGERWIEAYLCTIADAANAHYDTLIAHYDLAEGVRDPEAGFSAHGRRVIGRQLAYAQRATAHVLGRALAEAGVSPPAVDLSVAGVLAALRVPVKAVLARLEDAAERRLVTAMFDELMTTGRVDATLPEDDRAVRDLHAREVLGPKLAARAAARSQRLGLVVGSSDAEPRPLPQPSTLVAPPPPREVPSPRVSAVIRPMPEPRSPRPRLIRSDKLEAAPSIGARTEARLNAVGLATVADLVDGNAADIAARLGDARIDRATIERWQAEAGLVLAIPDLTGTHAQLLVSAGFTSVSALAEAEPPALAAALLRVAGTAAGQRLLRDGSAPDVERIKTWVDAASALCRAA